jgi:hypothetical protein
MSDSREIDWAALVQMMDQNAPKQEDVAYEFSDGKTFQRDPDGGVYADD